MRGEGRDWVPEKRGGGRGMGVEERDRLGERGLMSGSGCGLLTQIAAGEKTNEV